MIEMDDLEVRDILFCDNLPNQVRQQRTRQAVDRALSEGAATADGLPTAQGLADHHFRWSAARDA
jgi:hypothetical protein